MLNNHINNLSIKYKLLLYLIIPVLTILYFSISGINLKFVQQQNGSNLREFVQISFQLDDLIHEMQKERGISAGFIASGGKILHEELQAQRQLTDDKVRTFSRELDVVGRKKIDWGFPDFFSRAKLILQKLIHIRNDVNRLNYRDFFEDYSDLILAGLDIISHLQVITTDAKIARQSDAYTDLLLLQEYSAQERGLLNGIFTSGNLDAKRFKLFAGYVSEQDILLKKIYSVASKKQQTLLHDKMMHAEVTEMEKLRKAVIHKAVKNDQLNSLLGFIGYGGLIHDFKNYVIRGKQSYVKSFDKLYVEAINNIKEYQLLPSMNESEVDALNIIKKTMGNYKSLLENTRRLKAKGLSISEIDSIVKVDDRPALEAFKYLHKSITGLDTRKWWEKSSVRIDLIRDVSNSVRIDIAELTKKNLSDATRSLNLYLALTISSLIISFILGYRIIRYLLNSIIDLEMHMSNMQKYNEYDKLLNVSGNDEISKVAVAFNNLVNERNKFDEQLRLAATVFEKASEAMVITDADNHFLKVNTAFTDITGYCLDDVIGCTPVILQSGKQDSDFYHEMWESLVRYGNWSGEIINRRKNGELYPEWLNINVIRDSQGKITKHIAMFSDITERKQHEVKQAELQHQLLQAQKMESLGQLTGGIAHDFNNMLSAILGYTSLAMELDNDKEKLNHYLNEVELAGNRAKELVVQMLTFSRGSQDIEFQVLNIDSLLKESINMIRPVLPSTIEIVTHISNDTTAIMANPVMINQVVMNLCINARDAIGEHGRIDLGLSSISINTAVCSACHQEISGDFIEVSIKDTGSGIEPNIIKNLFEPFFTTKKMGNEKGTGMGLAMVHGILHEHNGHIIVESTPGNGSNFRLLFPLASVSDIAENKSDSVIENIESTEQRTMDDVSAHNILLVDDEESIVLLMTELLQNYGFNVTGYADSEQALAHFKENKDKYDLVITDQTMPKLTGVELSKAIIEIRPNISIILCSGYSDNIDKEGTESIGIKSYMTKPVNMKDLFNTIIKLLS